MNYKTTFILFFISILQLSGCATGGLDDFINEPEYKEMSTQAFNITKAYMSEDDDLIVCVEGDGWSGNFKPLIKQYISYSDSTKSKKKEISRVTTKYIIKNEQCKYIEYEDTEWVLIPAINLKNINVINTINKTPSISPSSLNLIEGIYIFSEGINRNILLVSSSNIFMENQYLYMNVPDKYIEAIEKSSVLKIFYIFSPITAVFDIITFPYQFIKALSSHK